MVDASKNALVTAVMADAGPEVIASARATVAAADAALEAAAEAARLQSQAQAKKNLFHLETWFEGEAQASDVELLKPPAASDASDVKRGEDGVKVEREVVEVEDDDALGEDAAAGERKEEEEGAAPLLQLQGREATLTEEKGEAARRGRPGWDGGGGWTDVGGRGATLAGSAAPAARSAAAGAEGPCGGDEEEEGMVIVRETPPPSQAS